MANAIWLSAALAGLGILLSYAPPKTKQEFRHHSSGFTSVGFSTGSHQAPLGMSIRAHSQLSTSHQIARSQPRHDVSRSDTTLPLFGTQPFDTCPNGSMLSIVAHQDDDLLFINPTIVDAIASGSCVETAYLTAGDDGQSESYWKGRERGAMAAYAAMLPIPITWNTTTFQFPAGQSIMIAHAAQDPRIQLLFYRLPDGNLFGQGFQDTGNQSLLKLWSGNIATISSLDHAASYTTASLLSSLQQIMAYYRPTSINSQAADSTPITADHADHIVTGHLAATAAQLYARSLSSGNQLTVHLFGGYPIRDRDSNLSDDVSQQKSNIFFAYAQFDADSCKSLAECQQESSSYATYVSRSYQYPY